MYTHIYIYIYIYMYICADERVRRRVGATRKIRDKRRRRSCGPAKIVASIIATISIAIINIMIIVSISICVYLYIQSVSVKHFAIGIGSIEPAGARLFQGAFGSRQGPWTVYSAEGGVVDGGCSGLG